VGLLGCSSIEFSPGGGGGTAGKFNVATKSATGTVTIPTTGSYNQNFLWDGSAVMVQGTALQWARPNAAGTATTLFPSFASSYPSPLVATAGRRSSPAHCDAPQRRPSGVHGASC
jgi:hypothetical protein